jgi:hypothetical protein
MLLDETRRVCQRIRNVEAKLIGSRRLQCIDHWIELDVAAIQLQCSKLIEAKVLDEELASCVLTDLEMVDQSMSFESGDSHNNKACKPHRSTGTSHVVKVSS